MYIGSSSNPAKKSVAEGSNERLLRHLIHLPGLEKCRAIGDAEGEGGKKEIGSPRFRSSFVKRTFASYWIEVKVPSPTKQTLKSPRWTTMTIRLSDCLQNCQSRGSLPSSSMICQGSRLRRVIAEKERWKEIKGEK